MKLPLNTTISDYIAKRQIGYWDGNKIVENYVREENNPPVYEIQNILSPFVRSVLILVGIIMILAALTMKWWYRRNYSTNTVP